MHIVSIARAESQGLTEEAVTASTTTGRHDHAEGLRRVAARSAATSRAEAMASTLRGVWERLGGPQRAGLKTRLVDVAVEDFGVKGAVLALQPQASPHITCGPKQAGICNVVARVKGKDLTNEAGTATTTSHADRAEGLREVAATTAAAALAEAMASTLRGMREHLGGPEGAGRTKGRARDGRSGSLSPLGSCFEWLFR